MSDNSSIYILQSLDGYRIIQSKNIDNLYWWANCCKKPNIQKDALVTTKDNLFHDKCLSCGTLDPQDEKRKELNPKELLNYFGKCIIYDTEKEVMEEACNIFDESLSDDLGTISFISGWEDKFFPQI